MWLHGISINIYSQVAIVMLIGLAAKNGVLIVEFANQLRDRGVEFMAGDRRSGFAHPPATGADDQPVQRVRRRYRCCSRMGAGAENRKPIGAVVLYGVLISMVLTLVVVPAVYALMARNTRSPRYWTRIIERMKLAQPAAEPESIPGTRN